MASLKFTQNEINEFIKLYNSGESCTQIAKKYNTTGNTISSMLKRNGIEVINRQNQLNFDINDVIEDYNKGKSLAQLAKKYKTTANCLSRKLKQKNIEIINQQNRTKFNENIFDSIDTEEKAYWLGFIFADGYISSINTGKKNKYGFEISLQLRDTNHLIKFNKFMQHEKNNVKTDSFRCRWSVVNKHLWETLNSYGCTPRKSLTLEFPNLEIFKDKSLIRHFIRGYFDGDGCISHQDKEQIIPVISVLGTVDFLSTIQNYILMDNCALIKNHDNNNVTFAIHRNAVKAIMFIYTLYYKSNIYLDRKYQKFLQYKDCRFKAKALELLEEKIGEGWDANPELIVDLKDLQQCNA